MAGSVPIGKTHRFAIRLDDRYALAAGVFRPEPQSSAELRDSLGVAAVASTPTHAEMGRAPGQGRDLDAASICNRSCRTTPNDSHFAIASAFLRAGISVVCEKPLTRDSTRAPPSWVRLAQRSETSLLAVPTATPRAPWSDTLPG